MSTPSLIVGNREFAKSDKYAVQRQAELHNHEPCCIVVCCSDSRVPPEIIFNELNLGTMFVVRTAGHVLDSGAMESIKYALQHLHANNVIVLGHQNCGAVRAVYDAVTTNTYSTCIEYPFLCKYITPSITQVGPDPQVNVNASEEKNIINTVNIIRDTFHLEPITTKGAYYNMETGKVSLIHPVAPGSKPQVFSPKGCRKYRTTRHHRHH